jgi:hypothetical protein
VPKLSHLASRTPGLTRLDPDNSYVHNTITIDRGILRVKEMVTWDEGGYPLPTRTSHNDPTWKRGTLGALPTTPAKLKFVGCDVEGHMANECVVEIPDATGVELSTGPGEHRRFHAIHQFNHLTALDTVDVRITNYPVQRAKPVPWGADFQLALIAAGYSSVELRDDPNFREFLAFAEEYDPALSREDRQALLEGPGNTRGRPFPYIVPIDPFARLSKLRPARPLTDLDSRPVCVPADE